MRLDFSVRDVLRITGGALLRGAVESSIRSLSTDTRTLRPGDLFIALVGERFDAHAFLEDAHARGACGALVERDVSTSLPLLIQVPDTLQALGEIASAHRRRFSLPLVAITGSNGKTTTRAMLTSILAQRGSVLAPQKSFNNRVGVPLTLLELTPEHDRAVLELGTNQPGEIRLLAQIARPTLGVITNIGPTHLEGLESLTGVAREKGSLLEFVEDAVLNADNPHTAALASAVRGHCVRFGLREGADCRALDVRQWLPFEDEAAPAVEFTLCLDAQQRRIRLPGLGTHHVSNALAAAGAAWLLGYSIDEIRVGLEKYTPVAMRTQLERIGDITFVNDAYNANPVSTQAALDLLQALPAKGRRIAVLGDMRELGAHATKWHRRVGRHIPKAGVERLITVGEEAVHLAEGAMEAGLPPEAVTSLDTPEEAASLLLSILKPGDLVLLKASRAMQFEKVLEAIRSAKQAEGARAS